MLDHVTKECDDAIRKGVDAMIRQCHDGFLQMNHMFTRVWPGVNKYVNGVAVSDIFGAIRESAASVSAHLCVTDKGVDWINKEAIQQELATFSHESQSAEEYVLPPNEVLCKGYACTLDEKQDQKFALGVLLSWRYVGYLQSFTFCGQNTRWHVGWRNRAQSNFFSC